MLCVPSLGAQDTTRVVAEQKSPTVARVVGIMPGAGHIYAGETGRGLAYMGGSLGILLIGATSVVAECYVDFLSAEEWCGASSAADIAAVAFVGLWAWSIYDAGRAAHRTNARRGRERLSLIVVPGRGKPAASSGARALKVGLSLATP